MQLIFNADDFGLCRGVNLGIVEACQNGVVRSASLMVNMLGSEDAVKLAESAPLLGVGLHLTLTAGQPLTDHKELTDHAGNFLRNQDHVTALPVELIEKEFCAQVRRCMQLGITPTHIDSHHHVHQLDNVSLAFTAVAERYDLPVRQFSQKPGHIKSSEAFDDSYYALSSDDNMGLPRIKQLISKYDGISSLEIMTHPAFIDTTLMNLSSYSFARAKELEALCDPDLIQWLESGGFQLINFGNI